MTKPSPMLRVVAVAAATGAGLLVAPGLAVAATSRADGGLATAPAPAPQVRVAAAGAGRPSVVPASATTATRFHAVHPVTVFRSSGRLHPGQVRTVHVAGRHGLPVPGSMLAATVTVRVTRASRPTDVAVRAPGTGQWSAADAVAAARHRSATGTTISRLDAAGRLELRNAAGHAAVRVIVDGWYAADSTGATFHPLAGASLLAPTRVHRAGRTVPVVGSRGTGVPSDGRVAAVAVAVGVSGASRPTTVTARPSGATSKADVLVVDAPRASAASGLAALPVGHDGDIALRTSHGSATVSAQVEGYWTAEATGGGLNHVNPTTLRSVRLHGGRSTSVRVAGNGGLPAASHVGAALLSVTARRASRDTTVVVSDDPGASPAQGQLAVLRHAHAATTVAVPVGDDGRVSLAAGAGHVAVAVHVLGWFAPTAVGADVSTPQCGGTLPDADFGVVATTSGLPYHQDGMCFGDEESWAESLLAGPQYYLNLADPGNSSSHWDSSGPKPCDPGPAYDVGCAFNYGVGAARQAWSYAQANGAQRQARWWVDVETDNTWGHGADGIAANVAVVQGALHYLRGRGVPAGVYTETEWWDEITGGTSALAPTTVWGGGAGSERYARGNCLATSITGGPAVMSQWLDGDVDRDIAC